MRKILLVLLIAVVGCSEDDRPNAFCDAMSDFGKDLEEVGPRPTIDADATEEERQAVVDYNQELSRLAEPLEKAAPPELDEAFETVNAADLSDPEATEDPDYLVAVGEIGDYIRAEC